MAFDFIVDCSGERHTLHLSDDGNAHIDPEAHDVDLELSLAEMGAELPQCIAGIQTYEEDFTVLINDLPDLLEQHGLLPTDDSNQSAWENLSKVYLLQLHAAHNLCADAIEHVLPMMDITTPGGTVVTDIVSVTRKLLAMPAGSLYALISKLASSASSTAGGYKSRKRGRMFRPEAYIASAASKLAKMVHQKIHLRTSDVLELTRDAVVAHNDPCGEDWQRSFGECADLEAIYANREKQWQRAQLVRGVTAMLKGKPWPSI